MSNPLPFLSRWKMFDNLRRSLFEISLLLLFVAGWLSVERPAMDPAVLSVAAMPAYVEFAMGFGSAPSARFWLAFVRNVGDGVLAGHGEAFLLWSSFCIRLCC